MSDDLIQTVVQTLKPEASAPFVEGYLARIEPPYPNPYQAGSWQAQEFSAGWQAADNAAVEGVLI